MMPTYRDIAIKNKLKIVIIFTSGIILLLASVAFVINDTISYRRSMITDMFTLADLVGINSTAGLIFNNSHTTQQNIVALKANPHIILTHIFSKDGNIFVSYFREGVNNNNWPYLLPASSTLSDYYSLHLETLAKPPFENGYWFYDDHVEIFKHIIYKGRMVGTVYIQSDLSELKARFFRASYIVITVLLVSLLLAFLLASLLQKVITQPIYSLVNTMREVSEHKDYSIRGQKESNDELGDLIEGFNNMLMQIEIRDKELNHTNEILYATLDKLEKAQDELILSEKMAALGQLVAGIAHEINTPLGAIRSSVDSMTIVLEQYLEQLPGFFQSLSPAQMQDFLKLLRQSTKTDTSLSSKEKRKYRRALTRQLSSHAIFDVDSIADTLVDMGIYEDIEAFLPLLKDSDSQRILNIAYQLITLSKSTKTISTASSRAAKTVFALKNFARQDSSGEKVLSNIIEDIETVLTLYYNQLKHGVEVIKNYAELPEILCYRDELNQVWTNLLHNALQAMDYKGSLRIDVGMQDNQVFISFTDSGMGIPDKIKSKIFEPFFTTKAAGEGSGLGLDIVKKIIDKHEGTIAVESVPRRTTFMVGLPV
ncbi:MAG: ATP-binding protein [Pseudomonadota bacterium]